MRLLKDALTGITVLIIITAIITLIAMAAAPTLTDGNVDLSSGTTADLFNFSVTFTDADNDTATYVKVIIDGTEHELSETDPNDINTTDGKEYSITGLSFTSGTYSYNFTAADANDTASPLEGGTFTVTEAVVAPSVIEYFPSDNPSTPNGTEQKFGVKFDQEVDVTWEINDIEVHNETLVPAETWANYTNSTAGVGEYTVRASGSNENGSDIAEWTWTVTDSTPPASVTNLSVAGRGMTWINWTWDNPSDDDFDHNEIQLNETSKGDLPKSQNYYNATGLVPDTNYIITVYAIDSVGNKDTGMSDENTTLPNTPTGDVNLTFGNVAVNFTDVTVAGNTTVVGSTTNPANHYFAKVSDYYYIETTAAFSSVNISIPYNAGDIDESLVKLYHYSAGSWNEAANISVDTTNKKVSGDVSSLSTFAAGVPQRPIITINKPDPDEMPETSEGDELEFNISVDQIVTIQWYVNGTKVSGSHDKENITLSKSAGTYIINATASNDNGSADNASWILTVHPKFYSTGYRIWDANYDMSTTYTWTPQSFSGFFYDLEEDVSSETMTIHLDSKTDRFIDKGELDYKSVPVSVYFDYDSWGKYNLTGFMAEKYFAAYIDDTEIDDVDPEDLLSHGYLSKILIDEGGESSEKHRVTIGTTLPLEEGYALKAVDVDAESAIVLFVLLKDGEEVDTGEPVGSGEDYIYTQKIGSKKDVPIIIVHVESVFHGRETDAAFIRGVFQISENPLEVKSGDEYGIMEVKSKSGGIRMENTEEVVDLEAGDIIDVMGEIRFEVADDPDNLRYYPFITVDVEEESASTLKINAPATAMERDLITIQVTTGTDEIILGADVEFDGENIGTTDSNGEITHTLARVGTSTINATKVGYESASKTITVEEYVETQLRIESVSEILQTEEFELTVTVGGEPLSGASILVDNSSVGTTDASGRFNYTFPASGSHTVKAEKTGYIAAEKTINVIKPYSKFEATAFNITPVNVTLKEPVAITAKITNTGNIRGEDEVELKINGTAVDSRNLTLEPGEETSVNFTFVESKSPGTYYAEILNKGGEFHVEKKPMGWLLYAGIATVIGLIVVYLVTMRPGFGTPGTGTGGVGSTRDKLALKLSQLKMKVKK